MDIDQDRGRPEVPDGLRGRSEGPGRDEDLVAGADLGERFGEGGAKVDVVRVRERLDDAVELLLVGALRVERAREREAASNYLANALAQVGAFA